VEKSRWEAETSVTYFEILTALALKHFARRDVDWAVVEVGLGGRLDSTNLVESRVCIVTPIGFDHMDKLGHTPAAIATEKAGIFKPGVPAIIGTQNYREAGRVLRERADELSCPRWEVGRDILVQAPRPAAADSNPEGAAWQLGMKTPGRNYPDLRCSLLGQHQVHNAAAAVGALEMLRVRGEIAIEADAVKEGLASCRCPARVEVLTEAPLLVLDAAHTTESIRALLETIRAHFPGRSLRVVYGTHRDKDYAGILDLLLPECTEMITTSSLHPRAMGAEELAEEARSRGASSVRPITPASEAVRRCLSTVTDKEMVVVTGSFYVAGQVREAWQNGRLL
jgi:dihydrofolate synthase/folylpolyglutamate synthase